MVGPENVLTSTKYDCGTILFTAHLTPKQIDEISKMNGVEFEGVVPEEFGEYERLPTYDYGKKGPTKSSGAGRTRLEKRDYVQRDSPAGLDLSFISTPFGENPSNTYSYLASAGKGVTIYIIDSGVEPLNNEFSGGVIKDILFAEDIQPGKMFDETGHGSCVASKAAGLRFGVAKLAELVIAKSTSKLSSFVDAIEKVLGYMYSLIKQGDEIAGFSILVKL